MPSIKVYPEESPRLIEISAPTTTISVQELTDLIKDWEDDNLSYPKLVSTSGKEDLGGGTLVGITAELQNAQILFEARGGSDSSGTATSPSADGTKLIDTAATFITDGIIAGDTVLNLTDQSVATVLRVVSETELDCFPLTDGAENDWDTADSYKIWNKVSCEVNGGNIVAIDDVGATMIPFLPSAFTHVTRTSSASATLQEQADIQYSSFQNGVWIDGVNGSSGTAYPYGTPRQPVDNIADAQSIATTRGFTRFYVQGNLTVGAADNIDGYEIVGEGPSKTRLTITAGASTVKSEYFDMTISGNVSGAISVVGCHLDNLDSIGGTTNATTFHDCVFEPATYAFNSSGNQDIFIIDCKSGSSSHAGVIFDHNGSASPVIVKNWAGAITFDNITQAITSSVDMISGHVTASAGCTNGTLIVHGLTMFTDNSTGSFVFDSSGIVNEDTISAQVNADIDETRIAILVNATR